MEERVFVSKILNGNSRATLVFYKRYKKKIFRFIEKKIDNKNDAEEVCQDVFISALDSLPLFSFKSSLLTWIYSIAHHEVVDYYRKKKIKTVVFSRFPFLEKIISKALSPELALQEKELKEKIKKTFKSLSEGYRQILRLKYIDGFTMAEIAKDTGASLKSVESKLFRARLAFRREYVEDFKNQSVFDQVKERLEKTEIKSFKKDYKIFLSSFDKRKLSSES